MTSEKLLRTFIAVELPHAVKDTTLNLQTMVSAQPKVVKWVKMANLHLTLRFIGPTPEEDVPKIREAIDSAVNTHHDISLTIQGTGIFPKPQRPRVLWLGSEGEIKKVQNLVADINIELDKLGYPAEEREYSPHITIGRIRYPQKVTPDVTEFLNSIYDPIPFTIEKIKFIQSELIPGGPLYSILSVHDLTPLTEENFHA
tara:strand:- start:2475 stop:3074 length:600 start_codon:yes stop_codon:yes gene_type:complete